MVNTWDLLPHEAGEAGSARGLKTGWTSPKQLWVAGAAVEVATLPALPKHLSLFSWKGADDWAVWTTCLTQWAQGQKHRVLCRRTSGGPSKCLKKKKKKFHLKDFPVNQIFAKPWNILQCWCVNSAAVYFKRFSGHWVAEGNGKTKEVVRRTISKSD